MAKRIVGLDFETETDKQGNSRPLLCALYSKDYEEVFDLTDIEGYKKFFYTIILSGDKYVVFNASFDVEIIIIMLLKNGFAFLKNDQEPSNKTMRLIMGQKIYQLKTYFNYGGTLVESEYVDLGNLLVGTNLATIAKKFTKYEKGDFEASKEDKELFKEYALLDSKITHDAYIEVMKQLEGEYLTIGSAAFNIMLNMSFTAKSKKGKFGLFKKIYGTNTLEEDKYLRRWYAGGLGWSSTDERTEVNVNSWDLISAYPWASTGRLPTTNRKQVYPYYKEPTEKHPFAFIKMRVTGQIKKNHVPVLPSRNIYGDSNIYIYDDKEVFIIQEYGIKSEYEYWLENMEIDEIEYEETILMEQATKNPLKVFMEKYYHIKETTTGIQREFAKRLLNSLTGKLGTNPIKDNIEYGIDDNNKLIRTSSEEVEIDTYATHVVSVITSRIRTILYGVDAEIRDKVKFRMYATDSVKFSSETNYELKKGKKWGDWDIEYENIDFIFLGLKAYIFDAHNKKGQREVMCAGISRNFKNKITNDQFYASTQVSSLISVRSGNGRIIYEGRKKIASPVKKPRRRSDVNAI